MGSNPDDILNVYIDVDGVLNAMAHRVPDGYRTVGIGHTTLSWSPARFTRLGLLTARPDVQGNWLTDWEDDTALLCHLTGLDGLHWPVLTGDHEFNTGHDWWKLTALQAHQRSHPTRFAWVDNDLADEPAAVDWARSTGRGACLSPWDQAGLNDGHLATLQALADRALRPTDVPPPGTWMRALAGNHGTR